MKWISSEEYLSFLSETNQPHRIPDHLKGGKLLCGNSSLIVGIRRRDAIDFLSWINRSRHQPRFRLLTWSEIERFNIRKSTWYQHDHKVNLSIHPQKAEDYLRELREKWLNILHEDFSCDFDLTLHRFVSCNTLRDEALEITRNRSLSSQVQKYLREQNPTFQIWDIDISEVFKKVSEWTKQVQQTNLPRNLRKYVRLISDLEVAIRECESIWLLKAYLMTFHNTLHILNEESPNSKLEEVKDESLLFYFNLVMIYLRMESQLQAIEHLVVIEE